MDQKSREDGYRAQNGPGKALTAAQLRRSRHKLNHQLRAAGLSPGRAEAAVSRDPEPAAADWTMRDIQLAALVSRPAKAIKMLVPKVIRPRRRHQGTQGGAHMYTRRAGRG